MANRGWWQRCDLPVTARGVVTLVATNYGLFEPTGDGFLMREIAPGFTVDEVRAATGAPLTVADKLTTVRLANEVIAPIPSPVMAGLWPGHHTRPIGSNCADRSR